MTLNELVTLVAKHLATRQGYHKQVRQGLPKPLPQVLNNPGMLTAWKDGMPTSWFELNGKAFLQFDSPAAGESALRRFVRTRIEKHGCTLRDLFRRDTPSLGINPDRPLIELVTEETTHATRRDLRLAITTARSR